MPDNIYASITVIVILSLLPFIVAAGTCYLKFSIVFIMVRNALGVQQVPSNLVLNAIALILSLFVMIPLGKNIYYNTIQYEKDNPEFYQDPLMWEDYSDNVLSDYKNYLLTHSDVALVRYFNNVNPQKEVTTVETENTLTPQNSALFSLLPAYALSEIKSAFLIAFYIYLPFVVIDLVVSSILLALGMMMMSPVTLSIPIKLILFISIDGWTLLSKGLINQYLDMMAL